jgi:hypothetical protein
VLLKFTDGKLQVIKLTPSAPGLSGKWKEEISDETIGGYGGITVALHFVPVFSGGARQEIERGHEEHEPRFSWMGRLEP